MAVQAVACSTLALPTRHLGGTARCDPYVRAAVVGIERPIGTAGTRGTCSSQGRSNRFSSNFWDLVSGAGVSQSPSHSSFSFFMAFREHQNRPGARTVARAERDMAHGTTLPRPTDHLQTKPATRAAADQRDRRRGKIDRERGGARTSRSVGAPQGAAPRRADGTDDSCTVPWSRSRNRSTSSTSSTSTSRCCCHRSRSSSRRQRCLPHERSHIAHLTAQLMPQAGLLATEEAVEQDLLLPSGEAEEGVPPEHGDPEVRAEPEPASEAEAEEPGYAQYVRHGISARGLRHLVTELGVERSDTTNKVCQLRVKPRTVADGWVDEPQVTDAGRGYYKHSYVCERTGERREGAAPPGTRSMCDVLLDDPRTAGFVGRPTRFLSHAWLYLFLNLVVALEAYVASLPPGEPEPFFWFDCLSLDQHANNGQGSDWWRDTFLLAIGAIGHTVMMLSPWDNPTPLRRAWCLWELYSTHKAGVPFSVCLGPDERRAFEAAILEDSAAVLNAFSQISVEKAQAGDPRESHDQATGGRGGLRGAGRGCVRAYAGVDLRRGAGLRSGRVRRVGRAAEEGSDWPALLQVSAGRRGGGAVP